VANRIRIAPSILAADFTRLGEQVRDADAAGADMIHIDVMDGRFVPNITMGPLVVEAVKRVTSLPLDVHLMIVEPDHHLEAFARAGASRISVHWEACPNLHRTLGAIRALGCGVGVAINPHTPAALLTEIVGLIDVFLVMTVNPGFGGQSFLPETLPKIDQLRRMADAVKLADERDIDVQVDGGINEVTTGQAVRAGANVLVVGSAVFSPKFPVKEGIDHIRREAGK
jgi:ribulose-phosphate 3-epimerase